VAGGYWLAAMTLIAKNFRYVPFSSPRQQILRSHSG
jgi:hypothetical protein